MLIIQSLEKVPSKLKVSEKEKSSTHSKNTIDFNKDNVIRKKIYSKTLNMWTNRTLTSEEKISIIFLNL